MQQYLLASLGLWLAGAISLVQVQASPAEVFLQSNLRNGQRRALVPDGCVKYSETKSPQCNNCNGDGCGAFHCSAFTQWHSCDTLGDKWELCGYETCAGGLCEEKTVCGRNCDASQTNVIKVNSISYDTDSKTWDVQKDSSSLAATALYKGTNEGSIAQETGTVSFSITETQTSTFRFLSASAVSVSFQAGIPAISGGSITVGATETITVGHDYTKTFTVATTANAGNLKLAPYSRQLLRFSFESQVYQIPFTAQVTMQDGCGKESTSSIQGTVSISGIANTASGSATWEIGPSIPLECESPFDVPFDDQLNHDFCPSTPSNQCSLNVMCGASALNGDCGCMTGKNPYPCCSTARAHKNCNGYPPNTVLCPDAHGRFNKCCT